MGTLRIGYDTAAAVAREHLAAAAQVTGLADARPHVSGGGLGDDQVERLLSECCVPAGDLAATSELLGLHVVDVERTMRVVDQHFSDYLNPGDLIP